MKSQSTPPQQKQRIEWVDIAKGIAILLVVIGHSPVPFQIQYLIYACHIPVFFFLSGITLKPDHFENFRTFLFHKFRKIMIPYYIFSFVQYILYFVFNMDDVYQYTHLEIIRGIFIPTSVNMRLAPVLWFLPCLFVTEALFFLVARLFSDGRFIAIILIVFSIIGFNINSIIHIRLFLFADCALTAVVFLGLGYLYNMYSDKIHLLHSNNYIELFIALFLAYCLFAYLNIRDSVPVDMFGLSYKNYFYYYLHSILGIICCIIIAQKIASPFLTFLGKNSIIIFAFHTNVFFLINLCIGAVNSILHTSIEPSANFNWSLFYTSVSIFILSFILLFIRKFLLLFQRKHI